MRGFARGVATFGVRVVSIAWLVSHFALTFVYAMPITPLKMALQPLVYATVGRYFAQNWNFFAPNPMASNYSLLVQPLKEAEWSAAANGQLSTDSWYDLTRPVWEQYQRHRFSAYERLARPQSNGMRAFLGTSGELMPWVDACSNGDDQACSFVQERTRSAQRSARILLTRVASSFCNERFPDPIYVAVAIRIRQETPVGWSERFAGGSVIHDRDLGVFLIDRKVVASGLYGQLG